MINNDADITVADAGWAITGWSDQGLTINNTGAISSSSHDGGGIVACGGCHIPGYVTVSNDGYISTSGSFTAGIYADSQGGGPVTIRNTGRIATSGQDSAKGIRANTSNSLTDSDGSIDITNSGDITTVGNLSAAIEAVANGPDDISGTIAITNTGDLTTLGDESSGIWASSAELYVTTTAGTTPSGDISIFNGRSTDATAGAISVSGERSNGIFAQANSGAVTIENTATIAVRGANSGDGIRGQSYGRYDPLTQEPILPGGDVVIINSGDISISGTEGWHSAVSAQTGLYGDYDDQYRELSGGGTALVINSGALTLENSGNGISVTAVGGDASVVNTGSITGTGRWLAGMQVYAQSGDVTVVNSGDMIFTLTDQETIDDDSKGIAVWVGGNGTASITNSGSITFDGTGLSDEIAAISVGSDGLGALEITNSGALSNTLHGGAGITAWTSFDQTWLGSNFAFGSGAITIANSAVITVTGNYAIGIEAGQKPDGDGSGTGDLTISTSADIIASGANSFGIMALPGGGNAQLTINEGASVQGGTGATVIGVETNLLRESHDTDGDGTDDYFTYDADPRLTGSAGLLIAGGTDNVVNNAGTITSLNGLAISSLSGAYDFQHYDWDTVDVDASAPPVPQDMTLDLGTPNDTINNSGVITGDVVLNAGNDVVNSSGTITGSLYMGAGTDLVAISGGVVTGTIDGGDGVDRVELTGGSIGNVVNVESVTIDGTVGGEVAIVRAGSVLSGDTIFINNAIVDGVTFTGGAHVELGEGASVSLAAGTHNFAENSLIIGEGATLRVTSGLSIAQNGADGASTLTVSQLTSRVAITGGTLDLRDGAADDVLVVNGAFDPSNATVFFDVSKEAGSDRVEAQTSTPANNVVGLNFYSGDITAADGSLALVAVDGEKAPEALAEDTVPVSHEAYKFQSDPSSVFRKYYLVAGDENGLYLVWTTQEEVATNAPAVNEAASEAARQSVDGSIEKLLNAEVNGAPLASKQITPSFRLWSSGRLGYTKHSGFRTGTAGVSGRTAPFTSLETSFLGSAQVDVGKVLGWGTNGWGFKVGAIAGYARSDVKFGTTTELRTIGITSAGSGKNTSFIGGGYALATIGNFYAVMSGNANWGANEVSTALLDADSDYDSFGYSLASRVGVVLPVTPMTRVDLRGGIGFTRMIGDAHIDSAGNDFDESTLDTAYLSGSATFYTVTQIADFKIKPFIQFGGQHRFHYDNHVQVSGQATSFEDQQLTGFGRVGLDAALSEWAMLNAGVRGDYNKDFWTVSGNVGVKWKLN